MAADITINPANWNGNADHVFNIKGTGWSNGETIDTITIGGAATTYTVPTVNTSGRFEVDITLSTAVTATGKKDVIVTGSVAGATTFTNYAEVMLYCGSDEIRNEAGMDVGDVTWATADPVRRFAHNKVKNFMRKIFNGSSDGVDNWTAGAVPPLVEDLARMLGACRLLMLKTGPVAPNNPPPWADLKAMTDETMESLKNGSLGIEDVDGTDINRTQTVGEISSIETLHDSDPFDVETYIYDDDTEADSA